MLKEMLASRKALAILGTAAVLILCAGPVLAEVGQVKSAELTMTCLSEQDFNTGLAKTDAIQHWKGTFKTKVLITLWEDMNHIWFVSIQKAGDDMVCIPIIADSGEFTYLRGD